MLIKMENAVLGICAITGMMLLAPSSYAVSVGDPSANYTYVRLTEEVTGSTLSGYGFCEFKRVGNHIWATVKATGLAPGVGSNQIATAWVIVDGVNTGRLDTALVSGGGDAEFRGDFKLQEGQKLELKVRDHIATIQGIGNLTPDSTADAALVTEVTTPSGMLGSTKPGQCLFSY